VARLEFKQRENQGILILIPAGRLVLGASDVAFRRRLTSLLRTGRNKLILDLTDVADIDSAALGTLILYSLRFREAGGKLVLLHLKHAHADLPDTLKLNAAFESYDDEPAAVNSFFPDRAVPHYDILDFVEEQERKR